MVWPECGGEAVCNKRTQPPQLLFADSDILCQEYRGQNVWARGLDWRS